jgi:intein/homing endonuclease
LKPLPESAREFTLQTSGSYKVIRERVEMRWGRRVSKGTLSYYRGARSGRSRRARFDAVSPADWDWLVGLYYADGCKFKDKWKHVIVFSLSKSDELAIVKLLKILRTLELRPSILTKPEYGALNIRIYNKDLFIAIPNKKDTFHPSNPLAFVAGLFDGDGYVSMMRRETWRFSQASYPHLATQVHETLSQYGPVTLTRSPRPHGWLPIYSVDVLKRAREVLRRTEFVQYCTKVRSASIKHLVRAET